MRLVTLSDGIDRIMPSGPGDKIDDKQILICGNSGAGKSLATKSIIESYYQRGYDIVVIMDVKKLLEMGFCQFDESVMSDWQLDKLEFEQAPKTAIPVTVFHPYTENIPAHRIPETKFYTLPIKEIGQTEINLLIESDDDKTTRELLQNCIRRLPVTGNLWDFMQLVQESTERDKDVQGRNITYNADPNYFYLRGIKGGDLTNLDQIARMFSRFQIDMYLSPLKLPDGSPFPYLLDWGKDVLNGDGRIKIFATRYIKDEKTSDFNTIFLQNQLVENAFHSEKRGILVVYDEIKDLIPRGSNLKYKSVLAQSIAKHFTVSYRARHISSVSSTQSFSAIDPQMHKSNAWTNTFIMKTRGVDDIKQLQEVFGLDRSFIRELDNLKRNRGFSRGMEEVPGDVLTPFTFLGPITPHCEPGMRYDFVFAKQFPDRMFRYKELVDTMSVYKEGWVSNVVEKEKKRQDREFEEAKKKEATKEKTERKDAVSELKEELQKIRKDAFKAKNQSISERDKIIIREYTEGISTQTQLAEKYGIKQGAISNILRRKMEWYNEEIKKDKRKQALENIPTEAKPNDTSV